MAMAITTAHLDALPEECLARVISFTSPRDACRSSLVSSIFRHAAESDVAWEKFLPSDCEEIVARSVSPVEFSSKKDLFRKLSSAPLLIDGGNKTFYLEKVTNKKCYMLSVNELSIAWSTNSLCWCWKPHPNSRFPKGVELLTAWWLEIRGKMNTSLLSPNTTYGAYFVFQLSHRRAYGLSTMPLEVGVEVDTYKTHRSIYMDEIINCDKEDLKNVLCSGDKKDFVMRKDGWLEIELGEFYNKANGKEVKMELKEIKGTHLKGGLILEGIELRPKY